MKNVNEVLIKNLEVQVLNLTKKHQRAVEKSTNVKNELEQIRGILASLRS